MSTTVRQGSTHVFPADAVLQSLSGQRVEVADVGGVRDYLEQHSDLASLVPALVERTRQEFGGEAQLILRVYDDPEIDDHELQLCVRMPAYAPDLLQRFDTVCGPFTELLSQVASGSILVTTDHRQPD